MEDANYTNRELREFFGDFRKDISEIKDDGKETKLQTKLTNGRVTALENWQNFMKGGLAVISIMLVPILIFVVTQSLK